MSTKLSKSIIVFMLAALLCLAGCASQPAADNSTDNSGELRVTDMTGRELVLQGPAERVIAMSPSDCEILDALGAADRIVGKGEYCNFPASIENVPAVQLGNAVNIEQVISLDPQVVFASLMTMTEDEVSQLENAGIRVFISDANDLAAVYTDIQLIGQVIGCDAQAGTVVGDMKAALDDLSRNAQSLKGKTVYFEVSPLEYGLWTAGAGTFMNEIAELIGLENCFADVSGWAEISEEQVIERNPDYIVTITMYFGEGPTPEEEILSRNGWEEITAVKNEAILNLQNDELSRPAPRLDEGAQLLYEFVSSK